MKEGFATSELGRDRHAPNEMLRPSAGNAPVWIRASIPAVDCLYVELEMKVFTLISCAVLLVSVAAKADPNEGAAKKFDAYIPEVFTADDDTFDFKWYRFSQRQLDYIASRSFDEEKFAKFLKKKWPIEKLQEYAKKTPQSRLPSKVGYGGGRFFTVHIYGESEHEFDSISVTVFDQYQNSIALDQLHHSNKDGTRDEIKRWGWLISMKKGRKSWSIQAELPNHLFDKKLNKPEQDNR